MKIKLNNREIELTTIEVEHVVNEWYLNGMCDYLLHDESGLDLEEALDVDYSVSVETIK